MGQTSAAGLIPTAVEGFGEPQHLDDHTTGDKKWLVPRYAKNRPLDGAQPPIAASAGGSALGLVALALLPSSTLCSTI